MPIRKQYVPSLSFPYLFVYIGSLLLLRIEQQQTPNNCINHFTDENDYQ